MLKKNIKGAILCGGMGHRFKGHVDGIRKPRIKIGDKPILWHIMKYYEYYGFNDFVLCLGHLANEIKNYFNDSMDPWKITFADTGLNTNTGGRVKSIEKYIKEDIFMVTYGDGLSDIDLNGLLKFHVEKKRIATITCVRPRSPFGMVNISKDNLITSFDEKPLLSQWINGGFFVFNKSIFKYLKDNDVLEKEPFEKLAGEEQLAAYKFKGFWECMDTYKDHMILNDLWESGKSPWAKWLGRSNKHE